MNDLLIVDVLCFVLLKSYVLYPCCTIYIHQPSCASPVKLLSFLWGSSLLAVFIEEDPHVLHFLSSRMSAILHILT